MIFRHGLDMIKPQFVFAVLFSARWCCHSHQQGVAHSQTTKTQLHSVLCWNQTNQDNMATYIHPLHSCQLICTAHTVFPFLLLSLLASIPFICLSSSPQTSWLEGRDVGWNWPIWEQVLPEQWILFWLVLCKLWTVRSWTTVRFVLTLPWGLSGKWFSYLSQERNTADWCFLWCTGRHRWVYYVRKDHDGSQVPPEW